MPDFQTSNLVVYDLEIFSNYFLAGFMAPDGTVVQCETRKEINRTMEHIDKAGYELCGFNSNGFDDPVLSVFMTNGSHKEAYDASVALISKELKPWQIDSAVNSVDLMALLPGRMSLKQVGIRLQHDRLQELPIAFDKPLTQNEVAIIRSYNINDLQITRKLLDALQGDLDLRGGMSNQYGTDLRSLGGSQIAERVLSAEIQKKTGASPKNMKAVARAIIVPGATVSIPPPSWFNTIAESQGNVQYIYNTQLPRFNTAMALDENGRLAKGVLNSTLYLDDKFYALGVGGLHSVDGPGMFKPDENEILCVIDVASMYPSTMLLEDVFPSHIKKHFAPIYKEIYESRLKAKAEGRKLEAESKKLILNSTFGKLADPYSTLFDPTAMVAVTVYGQVALLTLIAALADAGIRTVSANTDGLLVYATKDKKAVMEAVVTWWEQLTGYVMEYDYVSGYWQRDVNNFVMQYSAAATPKLKSKGFFTCDTGDLRHSLHMNAVPRAIKAYLLSGTPVAQTIRACTDINQFLLSHAATKGFQCEWNGQQLGKLVRWYRSTSTHASAIIKTNAEKSQNVPMAGSSIPCQDLPANFPADIDYEFYIEKAEELVAKITRKKLSGVNRKVFMMQQRGYMPAVLKTDQKARPSRASVASGALDWNAMPLHTEIGISTGKKAGLIALVNNETDALAGLYKFNGDLPTKTRPKIGKDTGYKIIYGQNIRLNGYALTEAPVKLPDGMLSVWTRLYFTPAELKRAGVEVTE